ncbi:T9SS type A sorting domain-containing protein [Winogradskyella arenosi]|uniref:Putative secreted protein (Por secretion system target) n=1 Tax=Winogradskyella arenosi TaxID=533325 RepID=A0A368ZHL2_9FLAO|nr:T9SS type A sorting domain-containing protein [Winogradskyella arenosi]RCW92690.1 putative secreted protein (Por secretion system target) [Winogradskyella arenosi]
MKTILQFLTVLCLSATAFAQETIVNLSMQPSYTDQVYYKLSTATASAFTANSWDIAFLRTSAYNFGMRVNSGIGIEVFEAVNTAASYNTIDVANEANWTALYNSETSWSNGAFEQGSATYGFGEYNPITHGVEGSIVFVLKYADGTYRKFINESYAAGYTFKYATWNAETSTWSEDQTVTLSNTNNPNNKFNYYSLQNNEEVVAEPAISDWDFVFTKYATDYFGDGSFFYPVTGVLHSDEVTVAQNDEQSGMQANPTLTYSEDINTIGYDWKTLNDAWAYDVSSNQAYYIKYADDTIYRLYFTAFEGSSTGNLSFAVEDVTNALSIEDVNSSVAFGIYPNPTTDKKVNLVYDVNTLASNNNEVAIFSTTGQKVYQTNLNSNSGFYNKSLDLSSLTSGIYVLQFTSSNNTVTKKLILK